VNPLEWALAGGGALGAVGGAGYLHGRLSARWRTPAGARTGWPNPAQVRQAYALALRRAEMAWVRPGLTLTENTPATEVALYLGTCLTPRGIGLFGSLEEAVLVIGPPRMNKTTGMILEAVLSAPGACVVTSLRPDLLLYAAIARARRGPVLCWDAEGVAGWPHGVAWNPLRGCHTHAGARRRAGSFAAGAGVTIDEDFWTSRAVTILRCLLHAAAIEEGCTIIDVRRWVTNPGTEQPLDILTTNPAAVDGYAEALRGWLARDRRTLDGVLATLSNAVACLDDPAVIELCTPQAGHEFDPEAFIGSGGTLFLLCRQKPDSPAPLVTALLDELMEAVYVHGSRSAGERLDPPCRFVLDECATVGPPNLVDYASYLGGCGGQLVVSFQAWAQARRKYTPDGAEALKNNCTIKTLLGGLDDEADLRAWSTLIGERDEVYATASHTRGGPVHTSTHLRRVPLMTPADLQQMPKGQHVIIATGRPSVRAQLPALRQRSDWPVLAAELEAARRITGRNLEEGR